MCRPDEKVQVKIGDSIKDIDKCLADMIQRLNKDEVVTNACCCGHGTGLGIIIMKDGGALIPVKKEFFTMPSGQVHAASRALYDRYHKTKLEGLK